MQAKILKYVLILVVILGIGAGLYLSGHQSGFNACLAENNTHVAKVTQDALMEQERLNEKHLHQISKYERERRDDEIIYNSLQAELEAIYEHA